MCSVGILVQFFVERFSTPLRHQATVEGFTGFSLVLSQNGSPQPLLTSRRVQQDEARGLEGEGEHGEARGIEGEGESQQC